jgi:hypothetical protein
MNLGIVVEAKQQYTKQLINVMRPIIYERLFDIYSESIEKCERKDDLLICFQNELQQVPKWNSDVIKEATAKIVDSCSYINDLITAVFLSNVRILTSVKMNSKKRQVKLVVPTNETFVHKVYVNVSKSIYNDPFTFSNKRYGGNVLRNMHDVFPLIELSIEDTVRDMLPIKNILESYLGDTMSDSDSEPGEPEEPEEPEEPIEPEEPAKHLDHDAESESNDESEKPPENGGGSSFFEKPPEIKEIPVSNPKNNFVGPEKTTSSDPKVTRKAFFDDIDD